MNVLEFLDRNICILSGAVIVIVFLICFTVGTTITESRNSATKDDND